jgi:hypothetical protein
VQASINTKSDLGIHCEDATCWTPPGILLKEGPVITETETVEEAGSSWLRPTAQGDPGWQWLFQLDNLATACVSRLSTRVGSLPYRPNAAPAALCQYHRAGLLGRPCGLTGGRRLLRQSICQSCFFWLHDTRARGPSIAMEWQLLRDTPAVYTTSRCKQTRTRAARRVHRCKQQLDDSPGSRMLAGTMHGFAILRFSSRDCVLPASVQVRPAHNGVCNHHESRWPHLVAPR